MYLDSDFFIIADINKLPGTRFPLAEQQGREGFTHIYLMLMECVDIT
jgi:hypothetical protein